MVRALLDGRKTMTRRVLKPQPVQNEAGLWVFDLGRRGFAQTNNVPATMRARGWLRFAPGDLLWVRENHYLTDDGDFQRAVYAADPGDVVEHLAAVDRLPSYFSPKLVAEHRKLRPGIHMPRWASRLTLAVTAVKVERLQDITEEDVEAEGTDLHSDHAELCKNIADAGGWPNDLPKGSPTIGAFRGLWDSINGPGAWEANPWVVAVSFTVHRANVDVLPAEAELA
jgi:hypothetical protein